MKPYSYMRMVEEDAAILAVTSHPHATYIAGGTTLIDLMKLGIEAPTALIDINSLPFKGVEATDTSIRIGALTHMNDVAYNAAIQQRFPVIAEALLSSASAQIRNMATIGGNILQRTRCTYFRDTAFPCNKRAPGTGCPALSGENRMHAFLGASDACSATHPSDLAVALVALDALLHVHGPSGKRIIPLVDFYLEPGTTPYREHVLQHGDLIVAVEVPTVPYAINSHYLKVRDRAAYAFALVSAAVALDIQDDIIIAARVALGGIATKPWRAYGAEEVLQGKPATEATFLLATQKALQGARSRIQNALKIELARRTLLRALSIGSKKCKSNRDLQRGNV